MEDYRCSKMMFFVNRLLSAYIHCHYAINFVVADLGQRALIALSDIHLHIAINA